MGSPAPRLRAAALARPDPALPAGEAGEGVLAPAGRRRGAAARRLTEALRRELGEEVGIGDELLFEGPIAVAESIAPNWTPGDRHVVHIIFASDLSDRSLEDVETQDAAVRGARLFSLDELDEIVVHPPIKRFLQRWQPGDPAVYLGSLWAR